MILAAYTLNDPDGRRVWFPFQAWGQGYFLSEIDEPSWGTIRSPKIFVVTFVILGGLLQGTLGLWQASPKSLVFSGASTTLFLAVWSRMQQHLDWWWWARSALQPSQLRYTNMEWYRQAALTPLEKQHSAALIGYSLIVLGLFATFLCAVIYARSAYCLGIWFSAVGLATYLFGWGTAKRQYLSAMHRRLTRGQPLFPFGLAWLHAMNLGFIGIFVVGPTLSCAIAWLSWPR